MTIDTNIVVSGTISPGNFASQLLTAWTQDKYQWIMTTQAFGELEAVLSRETLIKNYHLNKEETQSLLDKLAVGATFIAPLPISELPIHSRDKKDDPILACALGGNCDYLVSEDYDLLDLNGSPELGNLGIITASAACQIFK